MKLTPFNLFEVETEQDFPTNLGVASDPAPDSTHAISPNQVKLAKYIASKQPKNKKQYDMPTTSFQGVVTPGMDYGDGSS